MKTLMSTTLVVLCVTGLTLPARAGADVSVTAEIRLGKVLPPPPPDIIIVEPVGPAGPPPWAPASGFRRNRAYYYYPGAHVYYRPADRVWFYLEGDAWRFGASLPASIRIDFARCVPLTMESTRPYEYHAGIVERYPSDFFARVQVKDGGPDHDSHRKWWQRKDKGKGKGKSHKS